MAKRKDITEAAQNAAEVQEQENVQAAPEAPAAEEAQAPAAEEAQAPAAEEAQAPEQTGDEAPDAEGVGSEGSGEVSQAPEGTEGSDAPEAPAPEDEAPKAPAPEDEAPEAPAPEETVAVQSDAKSANIPENALKIMQLYPEQRCLYISNFGGVFSIDTPATIRGNAVLYENPFYNPK